MKTKYIILIALLLPFFSISQSKSRISNQFFLLSGHIEQVNSVDSLTLTYYPDLVTNFGSLQMESKEVFRIPLIKGDFKFELNQLNRPGYIDLRYYGYENTSEQILMFKYYIEPGDIVTMKLAKNPGVIIYEKLMGENGKPVVYNSNLLEFSGPAFQKYQLQADLQRSIHSLEPKLDWDCFVSTDKRNALLNTFRAHDSLRTVGLNLLKIYKSALSDKTLSIIQANMIGRLEWHRIYMYLKNARFAEMEGYQDFFNEHVKKDETSFSDNIISSAPRYMEYMNYYLRYSRDANGLSTKVNEMYEAIKRNYKGRLRDRLLANLMLSGYSRQWMLDSNRYLFVDAKNVMKDKYTLGIVNGITTVLDLNKKGSIKSLDYNLTDINGQKVSLKDFKGKVVFFDFWYTGCGACTQYYTNVLKDVEHSYEKNPDIVFVTISIDERSDVWSGTVKRGTYTSDKAINLYTNGLRANHPIINEYNVSGYPSPFLLDRAGKVFSANEGNVLRNKEGLVQKIEEALGK